MNIYYLKVAILLPCSRKPVLSVIWEVVLRGFGELGSVRTGS